MSGSEYVSFYDNAQQYWSVRFDTMEAALLFARFIALVCVACMALHVLDPTPALLLLTLFRFLFDAFNSPHPAQSLLIANGPLVNLICEFQNFAFTALLSFCPLASISLGDL
jgi:hypothetical protein